MRRTHLVVGGTAMLAIVAAVAALLVDPGYFAPSAAALAGTGFVIVGLTGLGGVLLARSPWGRWTLLGGVVAALIAITGSDGFLVWLSMVVGGLAIIGLLGPWLRLWIRHRPVADPLGPVPLSLMAIAPGAALFVGVVGYAGVGVLDWLVVVVATAGSVLYGRGATPGLWMLRLAVPASGLILAFTAGDIASWVVLVASACVGALAWTPAATKTTTVITPPLPPPVERKAGRR